MNNNYSFAQKVVYKGKMQSYQLYGNPGRKQQMVYEKDEFNAQQNFLYKRVLFDLGVDSSYRDWETDRKSTRLNSSHLKLSRMPSSA